MFQVVFEWTVSVFQVVFEWTVSMFQVVFEWIVSVFQVVFEWILSVFQVVFECGEDHVIQDVTEPDTCQYQLRFKTPLVCHPHAMLVYPTLNATLRREWDLLEAHYLNEELTEKVLTGVEAPWNWFYQPRGGGTREQDPLLSSS